MERGEDIFSIEEERKVIQEGLKGVNNMVSFLVFFILVMTIYILFFKATGNILEM